MARKATREIVAEPWRGSPSPLRTRFAAGLLFAGVGTFAFGAVLAYLGVSATSPILRSQLGTLLLIGGGLLLAVSASRTRSSEARMASDRIRKTAPREEVA